MLKELFCESFKENGKTREPIKFENGLNIILGDKKEGEERNSIGKSTFLLIIDFIFGGDSYKKSEAYKHGEQVFKYIFEFNNNKYYFLRTNKTDTVFECNTDFTVKSSMKIEEYRDFLKVMYGVSDFDLSFRNIVGPYSRIYSKNKNITPGHVLEVHSVQNESPIKVFEKLNQVYSSIQEIDEKVSAYKAKKKVLKQARKLNVQLEETVTVNIKEATSELQTLEQERSNLLENQNEKFKDLDKEKITKIIEANKKLQVLIKLRNRLSTRRTVILNNLENNTLPSKASFDALLDYFPNANIKHLEEIESFHSKITSILEDEYRETLAEIEMNISEIEPQIKILKTELQELEKENGNFKISFLEKFAETENKINQLKKQIDKVKQDKKASKEFKEINTQLQTDEKKLLSNLCKDYNTELASFSSMILEPKVIPVTIDFPTTNQYSVSILHDDGTGSNYISDLIFDLAVLKKTKLPFLIHDSYLYSNIRGKRLDNIILQYNSFTNKQIFISIDELNKLAPETQSIILDKKRITLFADGGELFGESWIKEE